MLSGCFSPTDLLGFAPVAGYAGGRALRGAGGVDDAARLADNSAVGALDDVPTPQACFVAGTKVSTPAGEKSIENLVVGDTVISVAPESGEVANHKIEHRFSREVPVVIDIQVGTVTITCSPEHPFWMPGTGWQKASKLQPGTLLLTKEGQTVQINSIQRREGSFTVHNIEVEGFHTYCVSDLGILVHNKSTSLPEGGTYQLKTENGTVVRTGRTKDLARRQREHARQYPDLTFEVDKRSNDYVSVRGREQIIHDLHQPILNKVAPIRPNNPRRQEYLDAGSQL